MNQITIELNNDIYEDLEKQANDKGVSIEEYAQILLAMQTENERQRFEHIKKLISIGDEQLARGEGIPYSNDFMDTAIRHALTNHNAGKTVKDEIKPR